MIDLDSLFFCAVAPGFSPAVVDTRFYFGVGVVLSALLLLLALRPQGENRIAGVGFALCALIFTLGRCLQEIALSSGHSSRTPFLLIAGELVFCAAVLWPLTILLLWAHGDYSSAWRRWIGRLVIAQAMVSAVLLSLIHIAVLLPPFHRYDRGVVFPNESLSIAAFNALFFFLLGALVFLPGRLQGRLSWLSAGALLAGVFLLGLRTIAERLSDVPVWLNSFTAAAAPLSLFLVVAGGLFGIARFRFSDVFAQPRLRADRRPE